MLPARMSAVGTVVNTEDCLPVEGAFVASEKEDLVPLDRPTEGSAHLIVDRLGLPLTGRVIKERIRLDGVVVVGFEQRTVQGVGSALDLYFGASPSQKPSPPPNLL